MLFDILVIWSIHPQSSPSLPQLCYALVCHWMLFRNPCWALPPWISQSLFYQLALCHSPLVRLLNHAARRAHPDKQSTVPTLNFFVQSYLIFFWIVICRIYHIQKQLQTKYPCLLVGNGLSMCWSWFSSRSFQIQMTFQRSCRFEYYQPCSLLKCWTVPTNIRKNLSSYQCYVLETRSIIRIFCPTLSLFNQAL